MTFIVAGSDIDCIKAGSGCDRRILSGRNGAARVVGRRNRAQEETAADRFSELLDDVSGGVWMRQSKERVERIWI